MRSEMDPFMSIPNDSNRRRIHSASFVASVAVTNSASVVDKATICCRLENQEIGPPAAYTVMHPLIDLRVSMSAA